MVDDYLIFAKLYKAETISQNVVLSDEIHSIQTEVHLLYFLFNSNYYLFVFGNNNNTAFSNLEKILAKNFKIEAEVIRKKRLIRSTLGLFNYLSEMLKSESCRIIFSTKPTNFWKEVQHIITRKQKSELSLFLFQSLNKNNLDLSYTVKLEKRVQLLERKIGSFEKYLSNLNDR